MPRSVRCAVVLVTHDTRDEVLTALSTLPAGPDLETVVVDTGSHDDTVVAVRGHRPDVAVVELDNAGFGRGANTGVRLTSAPYVVVANADVRFDEGAIEAVCSVMEACGDVAAVGPRVRYPAGAPQASARTRPATRDAVAHALLGRVAPGNRWTRRYHTAGMDADTARDAGWLSGCALALRRSAFEDVGGFDPGYFLYVEDVDLCERLAAAGWRLRYEPRAGVVHVVGASTSRRRFRALTAHARSLDRYVAKRLRGSSWSWLRAPLRVALVGWVVVTWVLERVLAGRRSTTGERRGQDDRWPR